MAERGHVMLECIMVNVGATRYAEFRIFGQKVGMILGAETLKGKIIQKELEALKTKF